MRINIKKICVPTDFSEMAAEAILYGAALAEQNDAQLHVIHVLQDFGAAVSHPDFSASDAQLRDYFNELEAVPEAQENEPLVHAHMVPGVAKELPQKNLASEAQPNTSTLNFLKSLEKDAGDQFSQLPLDHWWDHVDMIQAVRYGNPADEVSRYANKNGIDLIVMGTHGRTGVKRLMMGSVSERVMRVSPCPVLIVRNTGHQFIEE